MIKRYFLLSVVVLLLTITLSSCFLVDLFKTDLDRAVDTMKLTVLPQLLSQTPDASYVCIRAASIVSSGTIITPDKVQMIADNADSIIIVDRIIAKEDSYFFMLDLAPGAFYAHPVKYILVPRSGSTPTMMSAEWLPRIGGVIPQEFKEKIPSSQLVIQSNAKLTTSPSTLLIYSFLPLLIRETEGILVVQGIMPDEKLFGDGQTSYMQAINFFLSYKAARTAGTVDVNGLVQSDADNILNAMDSMATSHSVVTVYIIAHGNVDFVRLGGVGFYASQFKNIMAAHPNTKFNFLLGSCHSGSFINDLSSLSNVRLVLTASKTEESAWPDWDTYGSSTDYNPYDSGSEWTSSLFERAKAILENSTRWQLVSNYANSYKIPTTSAIFYQAYWGIMGLNSTYGFTLNFDLCNRVSKESPQIYKSW